MRKLVEILAFAWVVFFYTVLFPVWFHRLLGKLIEGVEPGFAAGTTRALRLLGMSK